MSDGQLRSNRHRPTIDDLKEHFSEVLAMVTNDEADQGGDNENDVTPAAVGESEAELRATRRSRSGASASRS